VRCVCVFILDGFFGRAGVVPGRIWCAGGMEGGCGGFESRGIGAIGAIGMACGGECCYWGHSCSAAVVSDASENLPFNQ